MYWPGCIERRIDRKSTRLNSSHTEIYTLSLHDALPIFEHPRHVTQLCQAAFDHFGLRAPGVDVLAGMHREADAQVSCQLSRFAQRLAVLALPIVRKRRVRGERDQALPHPEEPDPVLLIPPQDLFQIGDVLPDES